MRTLLRQNSLLTGKNTGNFTQNQALSGSRRSIAPALCHLRRLPVPKGAFLTGNFTAPIRESSSLLPCSRRERLRGDSQGYHKVSSCFRSNTDVGFSITKGSSRFACLGGPFNPGFVLLFLLGRPGS